ncbi:MAG TPA: hypothetical protein VKI23_01350 [Cellulomonadaceae bacterium]|jgi:hypothetical protein|nr:hypothetical protein [Cellulomonadaceae bacterium]
MTAPGDALPAELDVTAYVGPYLFPTPRRRLVAGGCLVAVAVAALAGYAASANRGLLVGAGILLVAAAYHAVTAWPLTIDQTEGLVLATRAVGFPVGHASAQLTWRGLRSRPTWRILLYSADTPPSMRGLVELDAVDGTVLGEYTEANPEDWSVYTAS